MGPLQASDPPEVRRILTARSTPVWALCKPDKKPFEGSFPTLPHTRMGSLQAWRNTRGEARSDCSSHARMVPLQALGSPEVRHILAACLTPVWALCKPDEKPIWGFNSEHFFNPYGPFTCFRLEGGTILSRPWKVKEWDLRTVYGYFRTKDQILRKE